MEGSIKDLSDYRLKAAREDLDRAKRALTEDDYKLVMNRSYYAIFHSLRAVNALDEFDSSKHSGVIAYFNQHHVKNGDFPRDISHMISNAMDCRQKSDYEDFYVVSKEDAREQLANAEYIIEIVSKWLHTKWEN